MHEDWLSVKIRMRPDSVLNHVRQVHAPLIFTQTCPMTETWLPHLHAIAVNATERFLEILGYFTLEQTYRVSKVSSRTLVRLPLVLGLDHQLIVVEYAF